MTTILPTLPNPSVTNTLQSQNRSNKFLKAIPKLNKYIGSSMIELLIASVVALFAASAAAQLITNLNNSGLNRRAAALSSIEVAISNEVAWFQQYAVLWHMQAGPFKTLSPQITQTDYYEQKNFNQYYTNPIDCENTNMAVSFQQSAANSLTYSSPMNKPPNPIPVGNSYQSVALSAVASDYKLVRKLEPGSVPGTLQITYFLSKSGTPLFLRPLSIYLPAAGWC